MMAKRLSETTIWADQWYRELSPVGKLFWKYILDNCDFAGIWKVDFGLASFQIGTVVDNKIVEEINGKKVRLLAVDPGNYLFVVDFIKFQYGHLTESKFHNNVKKRLSDLSLLDTVFDTLSHTLPDTVCHTVKDKDKDKDSLNLKDKEEERGEGGTGGKPKTWKEDFAVYSAELKRQWTEIMKDPEWMAEMKKYNPGLDIRLSLEKAMNLFWGTEAGWKHKKKKRAASIDLKATLSNALSMKQNQVWERRGTK